MEDSVYRTPESTLIVEPAEQPPFYVVSMKKFWVLYAVTFTWYLVFWFYRHWRVIKTRRRSDEWPVMRALFNIFFTHALFREFDDAVYRRTGRRVAEASSVATGVVIFSILGRAINRLASERYFIPAIIGVCLCAVLTGWLAARAQKVANAASGDVAGTANREFTWANWVWTVLGGLLWALIALGLSAELLLLDPQGITNQ